MNHGHSLALYMEKESYRLKPPEGADAPGQGTGLYWQVNRVIQPTVRKSH